MPKAIWNGKVLAESDQTVVVEGLTHRALWTSAPLHTGGRVLKPKRLK